MSALRKLFGNPAHADLCTALIGIVFLALLFSGALT